MAQTGDIRVPIDPSAHSSARPRVSTRNGNVVTATTAHSRPMVTIVAFGPHIDEYVEHNETNQHYRDDLAGLREPIERTAEIRWIRLLNRATR